MSGKLHAMDILTLTDIEEVAERFCEALGAAYGDEASASILRNKDR